MAESGARRAITQPLVSVLIAVQDDASCLREALASACSQTHHPLEIIVVTTGSSDEVAAVVQSFDSEIHVVETLPASLPASYNAGLAAARGTVIALHRMGERWDPALVHRCVELLQVHPHIGLVDTDLEGARGHSPVRSPHTTNPHSESPIHRDDQCAAVAVRDIVVGPPVFDRRLIALAGGGFSEGLGAASLHEMWIRFLLAGTQFAHIPEPLATGPTSPPVPDDERLAVLERHLPSLWLRGARGRPQDAYAIARRVAERGERRNALWFVAHALLDPGVHLAQRVRYAFGAARIMTTSRRSHSINSELAS